MNDAIFQKVIDIIQPNLPARWKRVIFFAGYTQGSYSMKYYTQDDKGEYTDCFNHKNLNRAQVMKMFIDIDRILSAERSSLSENNKWSVMTMIVSKDGAMKTEFDFTDISENAIAYEQAWKKKYIV